MASLKTGPNDSDELVKLAYYGADLDYDDAEVTAAQWNRVRVAAWRFGLETGAHRPDLFHVPSGAAHDADPVAALKREDTALARKAAAMLRHLEVLRTGPNGGRKYWPVKWNRTRWSYDRSLILTYRPNDGVELEVAEAELVAALSAA
jgi:hypothetical protein